MMIDRNRFNFYLMLVLAVALGCGCHTGRGGKSKEVATLRLHLEVYPESMDFSTTVPIYRAQPVTVTVDKGPFLTEADVEDARVVDALGAFELQVKFNRHGMWILEQYTTVNPGKHIAIQSAFQIKKKKLSRWLAAPVISRRISNGLLSFTPDATREEAENIVIGLNNSAKKNREKSKW